MSHLGRGGRRGGVRVSKRFQGRRERWGRGWEDSRVESLQRMRRRGGETREKEDDQREVFSEGRTGGNSTVETHNWVPGKGEGEKGEEVSARV